MQASTRIEEFNISNLTWLKIDIEPKDRCINAGASVARRVEWFADIHSAVSWRKQINQ